MFEYIHHIAYVVKDMDNAIHVFRDIFELELDDHRAIEGETTVEIATFRCGPTFIEILRPINHPLLAQFLEEHGPGLPHVGFALRNLPKRIEELKGKGIAMNGPFVAGTGWKIAYFDFDKSNLELFRSCYHGDHIVEADLHASIVEHK
jgi:catechol 2,3-dioxygenase-like lactoylglutathione lyase family enzyme